MPPRANLHDISVAIGGLEARATNIEKAIIDATDSRREIHNRLEKLGQELISINNNVKAAIRKTEAMEPDVADWKKVRQNVNGGLIVLVSLGAVLFTGIGFVLKELWAWVVAHVNFK